MELWLCCYSSSINKNKDGNTKKTPDQHKVTRQSEEIGADQS